MKLNENTYISAYNKLDKIVEGRVVTSEAGTQIVLAENGRKYPVSSLKAIRLIEEDENAVLAKVEDDLNNCDEDKLKNTSAEDLEKVGEEREKELQTEAGMDIEEGEYKDAFVSAAKAKGAMEDAEAGNVSKSEALKSLTESEELSSDGVTIQDEFFEECPYVDNTDEEYEEDTISEDYQDVPPFDDSMLYDQANYVLDEYIANTKIFDENELFEKMCESFGVKAEKQENILDSIKEVIKVYKKSR